jgi:hypothetical protein
MILTLFLTALLSLHVVIQLPLWLWESQDRPGQSSGFPAWGVTCCLCEPDQSASPQGPLLFLQWERDSEWAPQLTHFIILRLALNTRPRGDRGPLSSGWQTGRLESQGYQSAEERMLWRGPALLGPQLSSCHQSGIPFGWDRWMLANNLLCVLSSLPQPPSVHFLPSPPVWDC